MSTAPASAAQPRQPGAGNLRVGIVPYLNVQPLIWGLDDPGSGVDIVGLPPSKLAPCLERGDVDAAISPIFEYLRNPVYTIVPGAAIGCIGPVASVLLLSHEPVGAVRTVLLDRDSLTSVNLIRILLTEQGIAAEYQRDDGRPLQPGHARLMIGDPAMAAASDYPVVNDLGRMWNDLTGLPFVFAAWLVHPSAAARPLNAIFQQAKAAGVANFDRVAAERGPRFGKTPDAALRYFRENMSYGLGDAEAAGIRRFGELCARHGLIPSTPELRFHEF